MTEKHYGDARVDADQLDRRVRVADREPTGNPPGCGRRLAAVEGEGTLCLLRGSDESGRPGSNRRRPAWEAFLALVGQGFFGGGSRKRISASGEGGRTTTSSGGDGVRRRSHAYCG